MSTHIADDNSFQAEVLEANVPVLVDFWAEWCGPCKAIAPTLEEISNEMDGAVKVIKVNAEEAIQTSAKYGIRALPTLIVFKGGEPVAVRTGSISKADLVSWIIQASS